MTDPTRPPLRVLLADDAAEMRALLRWALVRDDGAIEVVGEVSDGTAALEQVAALVPDVVILDLQMPGPPPAELLRGMAAIGVPIVTFSGFEPDLVAPAEARLVTLHVPKTTDLPLVREAILSVPRDGGAPSRNT
jgi:DNA-binding NarL/FixJ family response regulator